MLMVRVDVREAGAGVTLLVSLLAMQLVQVLDETTRVIFLMSGLDTPL